MAGAESTDDADELPIHTSEPMAFQSRQMLMLAKQLGLLSYRNPVDMNEEAQVEQLREDLGGVEGEYDLPTDNGVYYLVFVNSDTGRLPVLIREGEVRGFVMGLAVKAGRETAQKLRYYHGLLPA